MDYPSTFAINLGLGEIAGLDELTANLSCILR
jgi:hypothetical protein